MLVSSLDACSRVVASGMVYHRLSFRACRIASALAICNCVQIEACASACCVAMLRLPSPLSLWKRARWGEPTPALTPSRRGEHWRRDGVQKSSATHRGGQRLSSRTGTLARRRHTCRATDHRLSLARTDLGRPSRLPDWREGCSTRGGASATRVS